MLFRKDPSSAFRVLLHHALFSDIFSPCLNRHQMFALIIKHWRFLFQKYRLPSEPSIDAPSIDALLLVSQVPLSFCEERLGATVQLFQLGMQ